MKPALSVVAFTVLSGAGLGALAVLAVIVLLDGSAPAAHAAPVPVVVRTGVAALVLLVAGLLCSTLHLANPRNAWRSLARVRSSWLSREAAAALVLLPVAAGLVASLAVSSPPLLRIVAAIMTLALAWTTLYCTAMIYASLKPIRQWHTSRVPRAFFALAHASGALLVAGAFASYGADTHLLAPLAMLLLLLAGVAKLDYYAYLAGAAGSTTQATAIGVPQGVHAGGWRPGAPPPSRMSTRLLDAGHSRGTFLTQEFGYTLSGRARTALRVIVWLLAFALPLAWLAVGLPEWRGATLAFAACIIGLAAERWLFFAEARHTVRLYHGDART